MRIKITGKTDSVITCNTLKTILQGKTSGLYDITTPAQENEINVLQRCGLIIVENLDPKPKNKSPQSEDIENSPQIGTQATVQNNEKQETTQNTTKMPEVKSKKSGGRPKGAKNKKTLLQEKKVREAEAKTQEMGAEVIVSTGSENKKVRMRHSFTGEIAESAQTQASLEAMEKLAAEEKGEKVEGKPLNEEKLDPSEQMGRNAVISQNGQPTAQKMQNSIVPEAQTIKNPDPFIDREKKTEDTNNAFIDNDILSDESDAFIEK